MKKVSRRKFIQTSALVSGSLWIPKFLQGFERNTILLPDGNKVLVIVQLSGGNDGLNTIVPYRNDIYYKIRPSLAIEANSILKLNDELGFNSVMGSFKKMYDDGLLGIINSVGYPNPDLSHFRSMDIWHTASSSSEYLTNGWVGRYLDHTCPSCEAYEAIEVDDTLSLAMKGENVNGLALKSPERLFGLTRDKYVSRKVKYNAGDNDNLNYLYKVMSETVSSADYVYNKSKIYKSSVVYPEHEFGKSLKTIAELIISGLETKIYYVSLSGFDTHIRQKETHEKLLKLVGDSLLAFTNDLKSNNRLQDTVVMTFSEFGRRVKQNASNGTDHGTANTVFILNGNLKKKGFYNSPPRLDDLDDGNLKHQVDFRNVYATLLKKWMGVNDELILGKKFELMNFV